MTEIAVTLVRSALDSEARDKTRCGIGIAIGKTAENSVFVTSVLEGGAAENAVEIGDQMITVNGREVLSMAMEEIIEQLTGKEGSTVTLGLLRSHQKNHITDSNPSAILQITNAAPPTANLSTAHQTAAAECPMNGLPTRPSDDPTHDHEPSSTASTDEIALRFNLLRRSRTESAPDATPRARDPARAGIGASFTLCPRGYAVITAIADLSEDGGGSRLRPGDLIVAVDELFAYCLLCDKVLAV